MAFKNRPLSPALIRDSVILNKQANKQKKEREKKWSEAVMKFGGSVHRIYQ